MCVFPKGVGGKGKGGRSVIIRWYIPLIGLLAFGSLALMGTLFPYEQRGRPLGWLFGAMAGGMAFGSTFGVLLEPFVGWHGIFLGVSGLSAGVLGLFLPYRRLLGDAPPAPTGTVRDLFAAYGSLLRPGRGLRTYAYVLLSAVFHSGVFTWLRLYFARHYGLGEVGIGLALLGYGVPGFLFGPLIGRAADRWGRRWLVPAGLGIAALATGVLRFDVSLVVAALAVTLLSLGYDMTQPLLAGIVTALGGKRGGQAMGLNVFTLFTGFGIGSLATANRPVNLNPVFIGPPDLSSLEYANTVGAKLGHLALEKEKTKAIVRPDPDLLNPHVRERLLPRLIRFLPQSFSLTVVAVVTEDHDFILSQ